MHFLKNARLTISANNTLSTLLAGIAMMLATSSCTAQSVESIDDKPAHHTANGFQNLYLDENLKPSTFSFLKARLFDDLDWPSEPSDHTDHWQTADLDKITHTNDQPQATLIGHSTVLLQHQGVNVLTDPMFSSYASPFQFAGPKRYTPTALNVDQLPEIDVIVISHNHYDHLDVESVKALGNKPLWLVPLGLKQWFMQFGVTNVIELDWWQSHQYKGLQIQAMPSQHWSRRGLFDTNESLWASWAFKWNDFTAWFGGDTGYNAVQFKEIGEALGEIDLAMIPIGAYEPRWFMKYQHANPADAVEIFKDIKAKHAFGIHWNTFVLTAEPISEPPVALKQAMEASMLNPDNFQAMNIGASWSKKASKDQPQRISQN